jgi:uncharacterized protein (TIGR03083 family)
MVDPQPAIASASAAFADLIDGADLDARVPSCPEWSARDLVGHLGRVQRFWAANVRGGDPERPSRREDDPDAVARDLPPDDRLAEWMRASTGALLTAIGERGADAACWTWWPSPRTCGAVARHQVHEAAVHRWDLEATFGSPAPIEAAVADDGVPEFLEIVAGSETGTLLGSLTLSAEDTGGRWIIGDQRGPTATVSAPASDLVLLLYGRLPASAVSLQGDPGRLDAFLDAVDTE